MHTYSQLGSNRETPPRFLGAAQGECGPRRTTQVSKATFLKIIINFWCKNVYKN